MKTIVVILFTVGCVFATQWQLPSLIPPGNLVIGSPSFRSDNLQIYASIYDSYFHVDICYYDWNGIQWVYINRISGDVNTTADEDEPFITYDGQKLYYMRSVGSTGTYHLWVATWNGVAFDNSVELNSLINSGDCRYPSVTQDGNKLYFTRGTKIWESVWNGSDWGEPTSLPPEINEGGGYYRWNVTIAPDGNEIYFTGAGGYTLWLAFSRKIVDVWQQWQYCDSNINLPGCTVGEETLTYAPYSTQELYFARNYSPGTLTWHALRSPLAVEPASLGQIKAVYSR